MEASRTKGVTIDSEGNLYGTAVTGGSGTCEGGCGVAYKLTNSGGTWIQTVIHAFAGAEDGSGPGARVTVDRAGNIYGMAPTGGAYGLGTIYKIHPAPNGAWTFTVIHAFTGGADGSTGSAGRMIVRDGHLYGAATTGGTYGSGVVFQLTPRAVGEWLFRTIYSFRGQPDGSFPYGALLFDGSGNIYGTTYYGGANGVGAVYKLSRRPVVEWNENVPIIASERAATAIARSAILFLTASAISMGLQARVVWAVAPSLSYGLCPGVSGPKE